MTPNKTLSDQEILEKMWEMMKAIMQRPREQHEKGRSYAEVVDEALWATAAFAVFAANFDKEIADKTA